MATKLRTIAPPILTVGTLVWSIIISPYTTYGDTWAAYPVLIAFFIALVCHLWLIIEPSGYKRSEMFFYALLHLGLFFFVSVYSLMVITKDSL